MGGDLLFSPGTEIGPSERFMGLDERLFGSFWAMHALFWELFILFRASFSARVVVVQMLTQASDWCRDDLI